MSASRAIDSGDLVHRLHIRRPRTRRHRRRRAYRRIGTRRRTGALPGLSARGVGSPDAGAGVALRHARPPSTVLTASRTRCANLSAHSGLLRGSGKPPEPTRMIRERGGSVARQPTLEAALPLGLVLRRCGREWPLRRSPDLLHNVSSARRIPHPDPTGRRSRVVPVRNLGNRFRLCGDRMP